MRINEILDEAIPFRGNPQTDNRVKRDAGRVKLLRVEPTGDPSWDKIRLSPKRINPKDVS